MARYMCPLTQISLLPVIRLLLPPTRSAAALVVVVRRQQCHHSNKNIRIAATAHWLYVKELKLIELKYCGVLIFPAIYSIGGGESRSEEELVNELMGRSEGGGAAQPVVARANY